MALKVNDVLSYKNSVATIDARPATDVTVDLKNEMDVSEEESNILLS
jgi:hypothetical protein